MYIITTWRITSGEEWKYRKGEGGLSIRAGYQPASVLAIPLTDPCAPVRTLEEVINDENMHARGALEWQDHPEYGRIVVQQSPFRFDGVPRFPLKPSQSLGEDTEAILRDWLGMTDADVRAAAGSGANEKPLKV
ncbi:CoA transferase [Sphingomonas sp.]|uniref:CoA transferase n=1 Tax=Sphingomonas sp. TaxID=28214 RepID=UPI003750623B